MKIPRFLRPSHLVLASCLVPFLGGSLADANTWWRGNLHTHTFWSDGDSFPELVVDWYKENGYHFLALSDHNILSQGQKWINPRKHPGTRGYGEDTLRLYRGRFGSNWVETHVVDEEFIRWMRDRPGGRERQLPDGQMEPGDEVVRLKPLNEFRPLFDEPGRFLLLQSEEITTRPLNVHLNATNVIELIEPVPGETVGATIRANLEAVRAQALRFDQPMMGFLNHPNFQWAVTVEDMFEADNLRFFELYNGHPKVYNDGDDTRPGTERMWDVLLTHRLEKKGADLVYGLATDDAHEHVPAPNSSMSVPGRGWVMVRASHLTPEKLIDAMERGDFYASTGVSLNEIVFDGATLSVEVAAEPDVEYRIEFVGTRRGGDVGAVFAESDGLRARYTLQGDDLYVRARISSTQLQTRPVGPDDFQRAWVQPVVAAGREITRARDKK